MEFVQKDVQITPHYFRDDGVVPNSAFPLIVYQNALSLPEDDPARAYEQVFAANRWSRSWRNGIYPFHHYHATAHEVLGIAQGSARVCMGGEQGVRLTIGPGRCHGHSRRRGTQKPGREFRSIGRRRVSRWTASGPVPRKCP